MFNKHMEQSAEENSHSYRRISASCCSLLVSSFVAVSGWTGLLSKLFILLADFIEFLHVVEEVGASLKSDEEFGFLAVSVTSWTLHGDSSRSNLLKDGIVVSKMMNKIKRYLCTYLTRFSDAMTLVETALPRACSSIVS